MTRLPPLRAPRLHYRGFHTRQYWSAMYRLQRRLYRSYYRESSFGDIILATLIGIWVVFWVDAAVATQEHFSARVVRVIDGDTLVIGHEFRGTSRFRILGIDCPESGERLAKEATNLTAKMVEGKQIEFAGHGHDRYGRLVVEVWVDGESLALALLSAGLARYWREYAPGYMDYEAAEREARAARRGIWSTASP